MYYLKYYKYDDSQTMFSDSDQKSKDSKDEFEVRASNPDPNAKQVGVDDVQTSNESAASSAFPTTQPNLKVAINDVRQEGNDIYITTTITPSTSGECVIEVTRTGEISRSETRAFKGTSCQDGPFDVGGMSKGLWSVTVKVHVSNNVATDTRDIAIH